MRLIRNTILTLVLTMALLVSAAFVGLSSSKIQASSTVRQVTPTFAINTDCKDATLDKNNCDIIRYLIDIINVLSGLVGIIVIIMIIIGGIQYTSAGDNPEKIQAAKGKIANALVALLVFIFMFAFLQWVVPGGIF